MTLVPARLLESRSGAGAATVDGSFVGLGVRSGGSVTELPVLGRGAVAGDASAVVLTVISSFQVFDQAYVMTNGGPANATNTIVLYIYQNGFVFFRMGYASAIAWVLFGVIFVFTLMQMRLQGKWVQYD